MPIGLLSQSSPRESMTVKVNHMLIKKSDETDHSMLRKLFDSCKAGMKG